MSWFSGNLNLLIRTCFALEGESQSSETNKNGVEEQQLNPLNATTLKTDVKKMEGNPNLDSLKKNVMDADNDCPLSPNVIPSPSFSDKTESILSFSTFAGSAYSSGVNSNNKNDDSAPSYLDTSTCRKRRHRRETSQNDVLQREGFEIHGILSLGRFGSSLLAKHKTNKSSADNTTNHTSEHNVVTLNTYHKAVLSETYQQHIPHREKSLLESFDHPFISTILGTFSDRNCLYLISPLEAGGPLSHLLQNALSYGISDKMKIFYAACVLSVLKYAHSQHIIHRGLHPDSLLIDARGYLKVTDWGFAKLVTDRTYTLCGHVEYLCPEAIHDSGYGKGADYWAFGVLIYDMFVGRSAFAPSSLDFKYDVEYDVIGTGGQSGHSTSTSSSNSNCSHKAAVMENGGVSVGVGVGTQLKNSVSSNSLMGAGGDRSSSPMSAGCGVGGGGQQHHLHPHSTIKKTTSTSKPLTGDTLEQTLSDPMNDDTGTIANILSKEPIYPSYMPHPTKSIVQGLCQKNMTQRLGTRRGGKGIEDIQLHIFFQDVEWSRLNQKLVQAPWVPAAAPTTEASDGTCHEAPHACAKFYPNYMKRRHIQDMDLYGPTFSGYNCPDWNSFV